MIFAPSRTPSRTDSLLVPDLAAVPLPVLGKLALVGYWSCPPGLRDRVDRWERLDERDQAATERDLDLMAAALAR